MKQSSEQTLRAYVRKPRALSPRLFINFKTFGAGNKEKVLNLAKMIEEVSSSDGAQLIPVVQIIDAEAVVGSTKLEVWVQHLVTSPANLVRLGVRGVFLNHSDYQYDSWEKLASAEKSCREVDLKTLVFAANLGELKPILNLKPDFAAYEPPELIGSAETSVSQAKPEIISQAVVLSKEAGIPLIVGAGIKSKEDVKKSLGLGAAGAVVSSAIVKAEDPKKVLLELTEGFK